MSGGDYLLYDGDCPVCSRYVAWTDIRARRPGLRLLDARKEPDLVESLRRRGIEINDTMVLNLDGRLLVGGDGLAALSRLASDPSGRPRLRQILGSPGFARILYPGLAIGRRALLRLIGRKLI